MTGLVFVLLDVGEWLGKAFVWLLDEPGFLAGSAGVLFVILVVLAGASQVGAAA